MKGCDYCNFSDKLNETAPLAHAIEKTATFGEADISLFYFRNTEELVAFFSVGCDGDGLETRIKINYCPFCGRKLREED